MTLEEERYLEECKKRMKPEQTEVVEAAVNYGIPFKDIQKVVSRNLRAPQMKQIIYAMMEQVGDEAVDFLLNCEELNEYQLKEAALGFIHGLSAEQVKTYAGSGISAHQMKMMRIQLDSSTTKESENVENDSMNEYMQGLMKIMAESIKQFQESNERFEALSLLVKTHVLDEKDKLIKELQDHLARKDTVIQGLKQELADKEQVVSYDTGPAKGPTPANHENIKREQPAEPIKEAPMNKAGIAENKNRLEKWFGFIRKNDNMLEKLIDAELSPEQMEEVRKCVECGLNQEEINQIIRAGGTPQKMQKLREIILLMKKRKEGA